MPLPAVLTPEQIAQAVADGEWKTLASIAARLPRRDGSGRIGVNQATAWQWVQRGNLVLNELVIDGCRFYRVPLEEQYKVDWGLGACFKARRVGRPTRAEALRLF